MKTVLYSPGRIYSEVIFDRASEIGAVKNTVLPDPGMSHGQNTQNVFEKLDHAISLHLEAGSADGQKQGEIIRALDTLFRAFADWADSVNLACWALEPGPYDYKRMGKHPIWKDIFMGSGSMSKSFGRLNHLVNRLKHHGGMLIPIEISVGNSVSALHYQLGIMTGVELIPDRKHGTTQNQTGIVSHELKEILYLLHFFGARVGDRLAKQYGIDATAEAASRNRLGYTAVSALLEGGDLFLVDNKEVYGNVHYSFNDDGSHLIRGRRQPASLADQDLKFTMRLKSVRKGMKIQLPFAGNIRRFEA
ncbi:hypothetical protein G6L37_04385 [Agrobacterium rubi]|nr:hypothetical protein [Agrobacterium rubi]NTF24590.1 hypothetical protein [Agrobacterium rubi]